jgi:magnesium transporter
MNEFTSVDSGDVVATARIPGNDHVADIAEALKKEPHEVAAELLAEVPVERMVDIFDQPEPDAAPEIIEMLPRSRKTKLLTAMSVNRFTSFNNTRRGGGSSSWCP